MIGQTYIGALRFENLNEARQWNNQKQKLGAEFGIGRQSFPGEDSNSQEIELRLKISASGL